MAGDPEATMTERLRLYEGLRRAAMAKTWEVNMRTVADYREALGELEAYERVYGQLEQGPMPLDDERARDDGRPVTSKP